MGAQSLYFLPVDECEGRHREAMEHISLYRKWRPQTFAEVVGQPHVTNTLANALSSGRLVHAYLFCGPRGTGKTSTARILAKAINCVDGPTAVPCNTCEACTSISQGTALDVIEIDAASNRKIDEIRELLEKIHYTPTSLRTKVYIVDEVHQLTPEASSALLKTLEEPPGHVVFVLATTEPHKILPTIVSRCQRFDFTLVPTQEIAGLLKRIASHEGIEIDHEAVGMIAEHAHGSVRDAIGVMDQISNLSGELVTQRQVAELLGEVESDMVFDMLDIISDRDTPGALALVGRIVDSGKEPRRFVESLIEHLRSLFLIQNAAEPREIVEATDEHYARLDEQSRRFRRYEVVRLIDRFGAAHREMRWSESARMVLECALVKVTNLEADVSLEGIVFRLDEMERKIEALSGGETPPVFATAAGAREDSAALSAEGAAPASVPLSAAGKAQTGAGVARSAKGGSAARKAKGAAVVAADNAAAAAPGPAPTGGSKASGAGTGAAEAGAELAFSSLEEKEKMRRAWLAVLGELKNQGQMRLYALLTRAKITGAREGEVALGFPEEASFQLEILSEPGQLERVEEIWAHFLGAPVKLTVGAFQHTARKAPPHPTPSFGELAGRREPVASSTEEERADAAAERAAKPVETEDLAAGEEETPERAPEPPDGAGPGPVNGTPPKKARSRELAERIKESFDGEILD